MHFKRSLALEAVAYRLREVPTAGNVKIFVKSYEASSFLLPTVGKYFCSPSKNCCLWEKKKIASGYQAMKKVYEQDGYFRLGKLVCPKVTDRVRIEY